MTTSLPTWDMTPYFPSLQSTEFSAAVEALVAKLGEAEAWFDQNGINGGSTTAIDAGLVAVFEKTVDTLNDLKDRSRLLGGYIGSFVDTDSRDAFAAAKESEFDALMVRLQKLGTRFTAWIGTMDVDALLAASQVAKDHEFTLRKAEVGAKHQMSPAEEALAAEMQVTGSTAWAKLHGNLTSQIEVTFTVKGETKTIPMSMVRTLAYDPDPEVRRAAFDAEIEAWRSWETALAAAMNGIKGEVVSLSARRGWESPLEAALFSANIDRATLDAMLGAAQESFPHFRRYLRAKARAIGSGEKLPFYDLFAPMAGSEGGWTYESGCAFVEDNFRKFSDKMGDFAAKNFNENWIDAGPRPGKRDGAYCMGTVPGESRILMNFKPSFGSVSTLAHELGHAYHNLCLKDRTAMQRGTPMTLAETASIFCETIIRRAGVAQGTDAERLQILEAALQGYTQVVVDITSRFLFEQGVFEKRSDRELSADELCALMVDAQKQTYGDGMDENALHPYMWAVKPHYYSSYSFYNYPYMFGLLFGLGLYARYEADPEGFKAQYDDLLSSTGLADAAELGSRFGIDIRSKDFWRGSLSVIVAEIDEFERLTR